MRRLRTLWFMYRLARSFGNGVMLSAWKTVGVLCGRSMYLSPKLNWFGPMSKPEGIGE